MRRTETAAEFFVKRKKAALNRVKAFFMTEAVIARQSPLFLLDGLSPRDIVTPMQDSPFSVVKWSLFQRLRDSSHASLKRCFIYQMRLFSQYDCVMIKACIFYLIGYAGPPRIPVVIDLLAEYDLWVTPVLFSMLNRFSATALSRWQIL